MSCGDLRCEMQGGGSSILLSEKPSTHDLARQRIELKARLRVSEDKMKLGRSNTLNPLDGIAEAVTKMSDQKRIKVAKARVQRIAEQSKRGLLPPVKRLTTIEFARKELQSLETHLR